MANWALASDHSRAGMVHSFSDLPGLLAPMTMAEVIAAKAGGALQGGVYR
jgi:hypothetical protein